MNLNTNFLNILREFVPDLLCEFPEYKEKLHTGIYIILENKDNVFSESQYIDVDTVYKHSKSMMPLHFFDILYENVNMFESKSNNNSNSFELIIGIDFQYLWNSTQNENTKEILMKYLKMFMMSIISDIDDKSLFGDTSELFEAFNKPEFSEKLESTIKDLNDFFNKHENCTEDNNNDSNHENTDSTNELPSKDDIEEHLNSLLNGKIGKLAKEIADETFTDLNIDVNDKNVNLDSVMKTLLQDPNKIMGLTKNIGSKLDQKMKSGEINDNELMEEASEIMKKMKNMPGMSNMFNMFNKKNKKGDFKMDLSKMGSFMQKHQTRERMLQKLQEKQNHSSSYIVGEKTNQVFRNETSQNVEKSIRKKKKKRKNKK